MPTLTLLNPGNSVANALYSVTALDLGTVNSATSTQIVLIGTTGITYTLIGTDLTTTTINGKDYISGGTVQTIQVRSEAGDNYDFAELGLSGATLGAALQAEDTNSNTAALESLFLGFDYTVNGSPDIDTTSGVSRSVDNILLTLTGANIFDMGDGNDTIVGTAANEIMFGGAGNDFLSGGNGNDLLDGGNNNDFLYGGVGNDTLTAGTGLDVMEGGAGNDLLKVSPGLTNGEAFAGGDDIDTLSFAGLESAYTVDLGIGSANLVGGGAAALVITIENVIGGEQGDQIVGTGEDNVLEGRGGNDTLSGLGGNDTLIAGAGLDFLFGGAGNDEVRIEPFLTAGEVLDGGADIDTLSFAGTDTDFNIDLLSETANYMSGGFQVNALGFENVTGGFLADRIVGNGLANILNGGGGSDTLFGYIGNDTLIGGSGADFLYGGADNDLLITGLSGLGPGDETYDGDDGIDTFSLEGATGAGHLINLANGTADALFGGALVTLSEIENVIGSEDGDSITGSTVSNALFGGGGVDTIDGGEGNDTLIGGTGRDNLIGGEGNDDFGTITGATGFDDLSGSGGFDRVSFAGTTQNITANAMPGSYSVSGLPGNFMLESIESLTTGSGNDTITSLGPMTFLQMDAGDGDDLLNLDSLLQTVIGGSGLDTLDLGGFMGDVSINLGTSTLISGIESLILSFGNDSAIGTSGADTLEGGAGNDTLNGGNGNDTVFGGSGDDTFRAGTSGGADDFFGGADNDTLDFSALDSTALAINLTTETHNFGTVQGVENAIGAGLGDTLTGDGLDNMLQGRNGDDTLSGGIGDDWLEGGNGNDTLIGGTGSDRLYGGANNDSFGTFTDVAGLDSLFGGTGVDRVSFAGLATNLYVELNNGPVPVSDGNLRAYGFDSVEIVTTGSGNDTIMGRTDTVRVDAGAGTDLVVLRGTTATAIGGLGTDTLDMSQSGGSSQLINLSTSIRYSGFENLILTAFNDSATGTGGNNILETLAGSDTLNGGAGSDTMVGGTGSDTYVVDAAGDRVFDTFSRSDLRDAGGTDTVQSAISFNLGGSAVLGSLEKLTLTGSAAINGTGNALGNTIRGNSAANTLNGGGGADTMSGGVGNDTYVTDGGDIITEGLNAGTDLVQSSVTYTLGVNVENLTLTGAAAINGTGNSTANRITGNSGDNLLDGGSGADTMAGGAGNDTFVTNGSDTITEDAGQGTDLVQSSGSFTLGANLENLTLTGLSSFSGTGNSGANTIIGNSGNNVLNGGGGADVMVGGDGNDTYITDGGDTITETSFIGSDHVQSLVTYILGANLERLTLTGSAAINGTGNSLANTLTGNGGANVLNGLTGSDTMTGGFGQDIFVFNTGFSLGNIDRIFDFSVPADTIKLENAIFFGLGNGALGGNAFVANLSGNAADASDRIIYETDSGRLYYDRDGTGEFARIQFATISMNLNLTHSDFFVI